MKAFRLLGRLLLSRSLLRLFYIANITFILLIIGYKGYLLLLDDQPEGVNAVGIETLQSSSTPGGFSFSIVGNINNSIGIFERRMIPRINASDSDFVVSVGNAVSDGGEDRYRALQKTLRGLQKPYLMTFGEHERSGLGSLWFYERFGPYFFSFDAYGARFIFLDATGKTPSSWQLPWLEDQLQSASERPTFIFLANALVRPEALATADRSIELLEPAEARHAFLEMIQQHPVQAVITGGGKTYSDQAVNGVRHILTGGGGGFMPHSDSQDYHFVNVHYDGETLEVQPVVVEVAHGAIEHTLESAWLAVHAALYSGYLNLTIILAIALLVLVKLRRLLFTERDLYPNHDLDFEAFKTPPLRVAMFSNSFLPFTGGVPISIDRLRQGLERLGHQVLIVAPHYPDTATDHQREVRLPTLWRGRGDRPFVIANPFRHRDRTRIRAFAPDVIHVHHPFWVGSLGLWIGRRLNVPVVWTYHTRLEHYSHYVPFPGRLFRNFIAHYMVRRFANRCDLVIVPTQSAEGYLRTIDVTAPVLVQPTGVDISKDSEPTPDQVAHTRQKLGVQGKRVLVSVSRLGQEKNLRFMLDAFSRVVRNAADPVHLLLIGEGPDRERLEQQIGELQLAEHVTLVGAVPPETLSHYYALGELFVFASRSETQGMVLLEAMSSGLPIVAVRASGVNDVMQQGHTGFLTRENPDEWAERVQEILGDDAKRKRMSANAMELAAQYSLEKVADAILDGYARARVLRSHTTA